VLDLKLNKNNKLLERERMKGKIKMNILTNYFVIVRDYFGLKN